MDARYTYVSQTLEMMSKYRCIPKLGLEHLLYACIKILQTSLIVNIALGIILLENNCMNFTFRLHWTLQIIYAVTHKGKFVALVSQEFYSQDFQHTSILYEIPLSQPG